MGQGIPVKDTILRSQRFVQKLRGCELASMTSGILRFVLLLLCRSCYGTASTLTTQNCLRWPPPHFLWLLYTVWLRCLVVHGTSAASRTGGNAASGTSMFFFVLLPALARVSLLDSLHFTLAVLSRQSCRVHLVCLIHC